MTLAILRLPRRIERPGHGLAFTGLGDLVTLESHFEERLGAEVDLINVGT